MKTTKEFVRFPLHHAQTSIGAIALAAIALVALGCGGSGPDPASGDDDPGTSGPSASSPAASASAGGAAVIASSPTSSPSGIAVDASGIYWMDVDGCVDASNAGRIMKAPLGGGSATVLASGQYLCTGDIDEVTAIALDTTSVYWTSMGHDKVMKIDKDGTGLTTLAAGEAASSIAVSGDAVYWTNQYDYPSGTVRMCAKDGSGLETIVSQLDSPVGLVTDGGAIYWVGAFDGSVHRAGLDGGGATVVTSNQGGANYAAVDSLNVYWTTGSGLVMGVAKTGGSAFVLAQNQDIPMGIATDGTSIYWTIDDNQGSVASTSVTPGGAVAMVATPANYAACSGLALDATSVYFTCSDGSVLEAPK